MTHDLKKIWHILNQWQHERVKSERGFWFNHVNAAISLHKITIGILLHTSEIRLIQLNMVIIYWSAWLWHRSHYNGHVNVLCQTHIQFFYIIERFWRFIMTLNNCFCSLQKDCCVSAVTELASAEVGFPFLAITSIHFYFFQAKELRQHLPTVNKQ